MSRALLVGNPTARTGRARELIARAAAALRRQGLEVETQDTAPGGATTGRVRDALAAAAGAPPARALDLVVALGGDGTFAEVARGVLLSGRRVPLGLVPAGTANDQARSLGLAPGDVEAAADVVAAGHVTRLDAGRVQALDPAGAVRAELLFFDSVGWGLHPDVLATRNRDRAVVDQIPLLREVWRDEAVYAGALLDRTLASWLEPTKLDAEVVVDGQTLRFERLTDVIVKATAVYGGRWVLAPASRPDDGRFELVPITGRRDLVAKLLGDLAALAPLRQDLEALGVVGGAPRAGARFELRLSRSGRPAIASQVDGDEWVAGDHFRVEVLPNALDVLTPRGFVPPWEPARRA